MSAYCTPIVDFKYDYLVVASKGAKNQIITNGIKMSIKFLGNFKAALETRNEELMQQLEMLFPGEIKEEFLSCFEQQYELVSTSLSAYEEVCSIVELLWTFSKYQNELIEECDTVYLECTERDLKEKIIGLLKKAETILSSKNFQEIAKVCEDTFDGGSFDNTKLNMFYNKLTVFVGAGVSRVFGYPSTSSANVP